MPKCVRETWYMSGCLTFFSRLIHLTTTALELCLVIFAVPDAVANQLQKLFQFLCFFYFMRYHRAPDIFAGQELVS